MSESAKSPEVKTTKLSEYKPPEYTEDNIRLIFDIQSATRVLVSKTADYALNTDLQNGTTLPTLVLNCGPEKLTKIQSVKMDGRLLDPNQFVRDKDSLTLTPLNPNFTLEIESILNPEENKTNEGLYGAGGTMITQCEAEGSRKISPGVDRPDNLAKITTTITADKEQYPVMLSNGNLIEESEGSERHSKTYEDPHPKPSYLFALAAGKLEKITDTFTYPDGQIVEIDIYAEPNDISRCNHAMEAVKKAFLWDYERFGLKYDLDTFKIVATRKFNSGAMENKGLNIFSSKYIVADKETATDEDFQDIERVVVHEQCHNWTGNRVTCRDWFQLTLKEGLTVFRDGEYLADTGNRDLVRISRVRALREKQFAEDAGPNAHPIKPTEYQDIGIFYTNTVYTKGAEVIKMIHTLIGEEAFQEGMKIYFQRHDGQAVTTEDFVAAMQSATDVDLTQFENTWYKQEGTPLCKVDTAYDESAQTFTLTVTQTPAKEGQSSFYFPIKMGLVDENGNDFPLELVENNGQHDLKNGVLHISQDTQTFTFKNITSKPVASLLRGFSAPVILDTQYTPEELAFLAAHDNDGFNRYEAANRMFSNKLHQLATSDSPDSNAELQVVLESVAAILAGAEETPGLVAEMLTLPSVNDIVQKMEVYNFQKATKARKTLQLAIATQFYAELKALYNKFSAEEYKSDPRSIEERKLKNLCLEYLAKKGQEGFDLAETQMANTDNMTDEIAALKLLCNAPEKQRDKAIDTFYTKWQDNPLVLGKWLTAQAVSQRSDLLERLKYLRTLPLCGFDIPHNVIYSIRDGLAANPRHFHHDSGSGYKHLADIIIELDAVNPAYAALLSKRFEMIGKMDPTRKSLMKAELERIIAERGSEIEKGTREVIERTLKSVLE